MNDKGRGALPKGVEWPMVDGETLDRLDALRARLADLGERVAAMEGGPR